MIELRSFFIKMEVIIGKACGVIWWLGFGNCGLVVWFFVVFRVFIRFYGFGEVFFYFEREEMLFVIKKMEIL